MIRTGGYAPAGVYTCEACSSGYRLWAFLAPAAVFLFVLSVGALMIFKRAWLEATVLGKMTPRRFDSLQVRVRARNLSPGARRGRTPQVKAKVLFVMEQIAIGVPAQLPAVALPTSYLRYLDARAGAERWPLGARRGPSSPRRAPRTRAPRGRAIPSAADDATSTAGRPVLQPERGGERGAHVHHAAQLLRAAGDGDGPAAGRGPRVIGARVPLKTPGGALGRPLLGLFAADLLRLPRGLPDDLPGVLLRRAGAVNRTSTRAEPRVAGDFDFDGGVRPRHAAWDCAPGTSDATCDATEDARMLAAEEEVIPPDADGRGEHANS